MKTKYLIDARLVNRDRGITEFGEEFVKRYSKYRRGERTVYLFDDLSLAEKTLEELLSNDLCGKISFF